MSAQAATPLNDARERERAEEAIEYGYTHVEVDPHRLLATLAVLRATPAPDTRLREALLSIIGEAEEVTEAQHGTPHGALYAITRRAREALATTREELP